jgi:hypothetical protein
MSNEYKIWNRAKQRAKAKGLEFTITQNDIEIPVFCPILEIPLETHSGSSGGRPNSPSLDRIDNAKGYLPNNIQVISSLANQMKGAATREQLVKFAEYMIEVYA